MNVSKERSAEFLKATPGTGLHLTHVAVALAPSDLVRVHETGINLVILPRATAPQLAESARGFGERLQETLALDLSEFDVESGHIPQALRAVFAPAIPVTPELHSGSDVMPLAADVAELTENFARVAGQARTPTALRLRIDRVEDNMCSAFHTDGYRMRLICTYCGPGTEWTPNDNINRREFYSLPAADRLLDPERVFRLRAGWVAILKGEKYPGAEGRAIVHRSPPATPGTWRLVLRIDCD